ncbi:fructose bisphosphate aldolase [Roseicyclus amphidinii]|uniref:fructose bisphosphate aldolase n=1 Tax=Roseicyclus amphidinii TaxID=3034232 RepID=UPI0024E07AA7|nr:fructose bisphosphate aldolase [Roseicyclus sp. Amp-Y-6]
MSNDAMRTQMETGQGFIAALDQSGGSTPKALRLYGIEEDQYSSEAEMFDLIHAMRARIATAPGFTGDKVIGAILFEMTMDREIGGKPAARYLWDDKRVVPFLKIDKGLEDEVDGVQMMKPIPGLSDLLDRAVGHGIFGTKERSVIHSANPAGIANIVAQQVDLGFQVLDKGLVPILEPEVNIKATDKAEAEEILLAELTKGMDAIPEGQKVMLKLTIPTKPDLYAPLIAHPRVLRVVALSGGYSRDEACEKLAQNHGMIASFSRGLTEGLSAQQSDAEFNAALSEAVDAIHAASIT